MAKVSVANAHFRTFQCGLLSWLPPSFHPFAVRSVSRLHAVMLAHCGVTAVTRNWCGSAVLTHKKRANLSLCESVYLIRVQYKFYIDHLLTSNRNIRTNLGIRIQIHGIQHDDDYASRYSTYELSAVVCGISNSSFNYRGACAHMPDDLCELCACVRMLVSECVRMFQCSMCQYVFVYGLEYVCVVLAACCWECVLQSEWTSVLLFFFQMIDPPRNKVAIELVSGASTTLVASDAQLHNPCFCKVHQHAIVWPSDQSERDWGQKVCANAQQRIYLSSIGCAFSCAGSFQ